MATTANVSVSVSATEVGTNTFGGPTFGGGFDKAFSFRNGTNAGQIDIAYIAERTVASGANDDIDLAGALSTALGTSISAAELVAIVIFNQHYDETQNTTTLTVGGATNNVPGFGAALAPIGPGGMFCMADSTATGLATVTASTGDLLRVTNAAGAENKYQIAILARSA